MIVFTGRHFLNAHVVQAGDDLHAQCPVMALDFFEETGVHLFNAHADNQPTAGLHFTCGRMVLVEWTPAVNTFWRTRAVPLTQLGVSTCRRWCPASSRLSLVESIE